MSRYQASRPHLLSLTAVLVLATAACNSSAFAERHGAIASPASSPYSVDVLDEMGLPITAYHHRGRVYVLGHSGERYVVRVTNPTPRRIEAVISIDGLDAVDGEAADMRKRGYVIQPYGELRVEGFRVSTAEVAAFRFSSVGNSYAGRKGKARNVGVVGVAIFAEQDAPQMPLRQVMPEWDDRRDYDGMHNERRRGYEGAPSGTAQGAPPPSAPADRSAKAGAGRAEASRRMPSASAESGAAMDEMCCAPEPIARPGLGTEFGEHRYSAVSWTQFVRNHPVRPSAVVELRYNNAAGLQALGIRLVNRDDVITRETAVPFPGDPHFARPPY